MNDFELLQTVNDPRWTNAVKCEIQKNIAEMGEAEQCARLVGMDTAYRAEIRQIRNLNSDIRKYEQLMKKIKEHYKDKVLSGIKNQNLVERYGHLHPNDVKSSIARSTYKIQNDLNRLAPEIERKKRKLAEIRERLLYNRERSAKKHLTDEGHAKAVMATVADMDTKIALVDLSNRKTEQMLDLAGQNLVLYDRLMEQLRNDAGTMAGHIMQQIEIGTFFKEDEANYIQSCKDIKRATDKRVYRDTNDADHLNAKMDSLERGRKSLMKGSPITETEEKFYAELPQSLDTYDDIFSDTDLSVSGVSLAKKPPADGQWHGDMSAHGMAYFVDQNEAVRLLDAAADRDDDETGGSGSSVAYSFPVNVVDYVTVNDATPAREALAVNYVLRKTGYSTADELTVSAVRAKSDAAGLAECAALRRALWKNVLAAKGARVRETAGPMTGADAESGGRAEALRSSVDEQRGRLSELDRTIRLRLKLVNDTCFYMGNVRSKLKKIKFSDDDIRRYSNPDDTLNDTKLRTSDEELKAYIENLKSMMNEVEAKIRWSNLIFTDDFSAEQFNLARAMYVYKVQAHIQEYMLQKRRNQLMNISRRKMNIDIPLNSKTITSREETKKQADLIVKYFNEKDLDHSKNKRKPISFRKSFI